MSFVSALIDSFHRDEDGQGLAEDALILALIPIVAILALLFLGGQISGILSTVGASVYAQPQQHVEDRRAQRPAVFCFQCGDRSSYDLDTDAPSPYGVRRLRTTGEPGWKGGVQPNVLHLCSHRFLQSG